MSKKKTNFFSSKESSLKSEISNQTRMKDRYDEIKKDDGDVLHVLKDNKELVLCEGKETPEGNPAYFDMNNRYCAIVPNEEKKEASGEVPSVLLNTSTKKENKKQ